jgi:multimeric flavodoxin WrbA
MEEADGFVFASPVWNFGVPAHLKNFIDRMGSFALDETRSKGTLGGKPFYLIFTGGAPAPAWKTLMQKTTSFVPEALKYFGASYMGHHFEGKCTKGRGKFGLVVDERPDSLEEVRKKGFEFARVVKTFKETGKAPIKQRATAKVMKWGEAVLKKIT